VGLGDELVEDIAAFGGLEVEREAALVAVEVPEIGAVAGAAEAGIAGGRFDLDDVGPPVGELAHAGGAGADAGEIEDLEAREGKGGHGVSGSGRFAGRRGGGLAAGTKVVRWSRGTSARSRMRQTVKSAMAPKTEARYQ